MRHASCRLAAVSASLWLSSWLAPAVATAQLPAQLPVPPVTPAEADFAVGRDAFVEGMRLASEERWTQALDRFERSYRLTGSPVALFNLGSTLRSLGRYRDARDAFDRLLADRSLDPDTQRRAERMRAEVAARIARLTVRGVAAGPARVRVDDRPAEPTDARPIELELDPGYHEIHITVGGSAPFFWTGRIADGALVDVEAVPVIATEPRDEEAPGGEDLSVLGVVLGVAAALAIGGLVLGLALDAPTALEPRSGLVIELP